jgi:predicted nucleotidyltransferase
MKWDLQSAVKMCRQIEPKLRSVGWHVGLTGSILYGKQESDKPPSGDLDLILYPNNDDNDAKAQFASELMRAMGIANWEVIPERTQDYNRTVVRAFTRDGRKIDFFILVDDTDAHYA